MEDAPRLRARGTPGGSRRAGRVAGPVGVALAAGLWLLSLGPGPAAQPTGPARASGPPGTLWGRLAVEEESPEGPWTPLPGVEITLYPYAREVEGDLDQIRRRARDSGSAYDTAVAQLQDRLKAYAAKLEAEGGGPPRPDASSGTPARATPPARARPPANPSAPAKPEGPATPEGATKPEDPAKATASGPVRRQLTDPAGLFVFSDLPAGEWLLVVFRLTEYASARAQRESTRRTPSAARRESTFAPRSLLPAKQAEVWLVRVRVEPDERARISLTERSRFMVGPIR